MTLRLACEPFTEISEVRQSPILCDYNELDEDYVQGAIDAATDIVYVLTGGTYTGICTAVKRPVRKARCFDDVDAGYISNWSQRFGQDVIPLPDSLVSVDMVTIDGLILAADDYGLIDGRFLARTDGRSWPSTNHLWADVNDSDERTFEVTFTFGTRPDWLAIAATSEVAAQLIDDDQTGRAAHLAGITSASVQGAQITIDKAAAAVASRGLPQVTRLIGVFASNPYPSGVWVPNFEEEWMLLDVTGPSMS